MTDCLRFENWFDPMLLSFNFFHFYDLKKKQIYFTGFANQPIPVCYFQETIVS